MPTTEPTLEEQLVEHLLRTRYEDLDPDTVCICKRLLMDALGVTFPGSRAPGCPEALDLVQSWQSCVGSTVMIHGLRAAPPLAALANSMMMHALDFDDTLDASALHAFVSVLPAALAAAEDRPAVSGRELITALVLGTDILCRISLAISRPLSWIRTATCGSFGAAAAAGKILGLDRDGLFGALGVVYSQTAGNAQGLLEGRLVKRMQPGFAASAGVTSAFLAQRGITGSLRFLTGPYGYFPLYEHNDFDPAPVLEGLGSHYAIKDLSIKPYPSCRMTHASIDAALAVRTGCGPVAEIDRIEVSVSSMAAEMVGKPFVIGENPQVDAQFSIPYTVACALLRGDVFLNDFETEAIRDPEVKSLADRVQVRTHPALRDKDILPSDLKVVLTDGREITHHVSFPLGNPANPMTDAQCREKFTKCLDYSRLQLKSGTGHVLLHQIENLENIEDIRTLIKKTVC